MSKVHDCLILGSGPAGLSTALTLARIHRTSIIFSTPTHRNDGAAHSHSLLTRDHTPPATIRALGRTDLARYGPQTVTFQDSTPITSIIHHSNGPRSYFTATSTSHPGIEWHGRSVVLATGVKDLLPADLEGYAANWPDNIYQCPVCDGHERSDRGPAGLLCYPAFKPEVAHMATIAHFLTQPVGSTIDEIAASNVTVFTNGPLDDNDPPHIAAKETLTAHGISIDTRRVVRLERAEEGKEGVYVHLSSSSSTDHNSTATTPNDEERIFMNFLLHKPPTVPNALPLIKQLGLELTQTPLGEIIQTSKDMPFPATSVSGVFVAGDAGNMLTQVTVAMSSGGLAAAGVVRFLAGLDDQLAVEKWRARQKGDKGEVEGMREGKGGEEVETVKGVDVVA